MLTSAQYPIEGSCPDYKECLDPNIKFTAEKISGIWYQQANIPFFFQRGKKCTHMRFEPDERPNTMLFDRIEYEVS